MQDKLRAATEELERAYKDRRLGSIQYLTAAIVLELAKIQLARTPLEFVEPVSRPSPTPEITADLFTPPVGYVECKRKCGRWTYVGVTNKLIAVCWDCWTQRGHVPRPAHAAEHPDWVMPAAKPEDVQAGDLIRLLDGSIVCVLSVLDHHWEVRTTRSSDAVGFTALQHGAKLLPRVRS